MAGLACVKAGQPGRFFYRMRGHRLRPGARKMRAFTTSHPDWLTVIQLPAYAPDLNPVEAPGR